MISAQEHVPANRFKWFDAVIRKTGARYLSNPRQSLDKKFIYVHYEVPKGNEQKFWRERDRCLMTITEIRKDQWWRVLIHKILNSPWFPSF